MTVDGPTCPESEVQIEIKRLEENEEFLERAVHLVLGCCDASDVPCEERDAEVLYEHVHQGTAPQSMRAVIEQANLLRFDLEEAERSFEFVRKQRDRFGERSVERGKELTAIRSALADFAQESVPPHVSTLQAVRWLIAEHDEQVKHNTEVGAENRTLCDERDEWKRAAEAETQGRRAEVSQLREQLAAATGLADELLMLFAYAEKGHPGRPCIRTGWIDETAMARLREKRAALKLLPCVEKEGK